MGQDGADAPFYPGSLTVIFHIYTYILPPDDGLLMPETCTGILTQ
jgi:hypothetical protein